MKRKIIAIVLLLMFALVGCSNNVENITSTTVDPRIRVQSSSEGYEGLHYKEVVKELKTLGFTNIKEKPMGDLFIGLFASENEVEEVQIGGSTSYVAGDMFYPDVRIVVSYHSYPESDKGETTKDEDTNKTTAEKNTDEPTKPKITTTESKENETTTESNRLHFDNDTIAKRAVQNYGKELYPYGIKFHWFSSDSKIENDGEDIWFVQVKVTITNQFDAKRDAMIYATVDFAKESVTSFRVE